MTSSIAFANSLVYTARHPLTIRDVYQAYATYGGINDFRFGYGEANPWYDASLWAIDDGAVWTIDANGISGTGNGVGQFAIVSNDLSIATQAGFVIEFEASGTGSIRFNYQDPYNFYEVSWTPSTVQVNSVISGTSTLLFRQSLTLTGAFLIKVMSREFQYSYNEEDRWLNIAFWVNNEYITAVSKKILLAVLAQGLSFTLTGIGSTISWTESFNPILAIPLDWASLDPGESPLQGLERSVGERHLNHFVRFSGELSVIRPRTRSTDITLTESNYDEISYNFDVRAAVNHLRVWGAYGYSDVFDEESIKKNGRRFDEITNQNIYTNVEAYTEGQTILDKSRSSAETLYLQLPFNPFVEQEDIIDTPRGKFKVISIDVDATIDTLHMRLSCVRYVY